MAVTKPNKQESDKQQALKYSYTSIVIELTVMGITET